jgi:hypothetical protein
MPTGSTGMTFGSLQTDLENYVERGSPSDITVARQIPIIINNAERSLADKMKIMGYRDVLQANFTIQNPTLQKPAGWRSSVSLNFGAGPNNNTRTTLRFRSYEWCRFMYPDDSQYNAPIYYADYDFNHWLLAPVPDQAYPFEATIYRLPDLLSPSNEQNYLTEFCPNLLTYECLVALEPFLRNDSRMPMWKAMRDEQLQSINGEEIQKVVDRALQRVTN